MRRAGQRRTICRQPFLLDGERDPHHGVAAGPAADEQQRRLLLDDFDLFTGPGDQPAFDADTSNRDNGLIYTANAKTAPGAKESMKMDFRHADRAPTRRSST